MYTGKTLFAQLMDFLPWTTFSRIVTRYGGDHRVRTFPCTEHFRVLAFAQRLINQARRLYATEDLGLELTNTVYALDSTTIDLCLTLFPWAPFRTTKAAIKLHTLLDLQASLYTLLQIFSVTLFEKIPLNTDFLDTTYRCEDDMSCNQLNLFDS